MIKRTSNPFRLALYLDNSDTFKVWFWEHAHGSCSFEARLLGIPIILGGGPGAFQRPWHFQFKSMIFCRQAELNAADDVAFTLSTNIGQSAKLSQPSRQRRQRRATWRFTSKVWKKIWDEPRRHRGPSKRLAQRSKRMQLCSPCFPVFS